MRTSLVAGGCPATTTVTPVRVGQPGKKHAQLGRPYASQRAQAIPRIAAVNNSMDGKALDLLSWKRKLLQALFRQQQTHELISDLCKALGTSSREELQELVHAIVLSECVYKVLEMPDEDVAGVVTQFLSQFPSQLVTLRSIQPSLRDLPQNYLLAEDPTTLYVAFMGTKRARDLVTDINFAPEPIWVEGAEMSPSEQIPTAHRGFLARSRAINMDHLHQLAASSGKRLVLCGHSLGGAVATLCTLRLLRELEPLATPVRSYCFATPAVGNSALAELVDMAGWHNHFFHYFLPEDQLMRMISLVKADPAVSAQAEAIAHSAAPATIDSSSAAAVLEERAEAMAAAIAAGTSPADTTSPAAEGLAYKDTAAGCAAGAAEQQPDGITSAALAASRVSSRGAPPAGWDLGSALAGRRDWALRKWQHIAGAAQRSATNVVPRYHAFGQQLYIYRTGVQEQLGVSAAELDMASEYVDGSKPSGPFSFHRMVAYRSRCLQVLNQAVVGSEHSRNFWAVVGMAGQLTQPVAVSQALFPAIAATRATVQLPLLAGALQTARGAAAVAEPAAADAEAAAAAAPAADVAASIDWQSSMESTADAGAAVAGAAAAEDAAAATAAATASGSGSKPSGMQRLSSLRRPSLPFLGKSKAGRPREDPVLTISVAGVNLQYCHYISVKIFGQIYLPSNLAPAELARDDLTDPPPQHGFVPLRLVSHAVSLARQAAGTVYHLATGSKGSLQLPLPEESEMQVRVPLPAPVVNRLAAALAAGADPSKVVEVTLKSDFQQLSVPVEVQGHRVALLGMSPELAAFVLAALAGRLQLPKAGAAPKPLARWLPRPQWLSNLRRGPVRNGKTSVAAASGGGAGTQQQEGAAVQAVDKGPAPWAPVAAAAAAAAVAALQGTTAAAVLPQDMLPPPAPAVGVIGRAAAASESFVAATGRLVGLSRQLRAAGSGASAAAAEAAEAAAAAGPTPGSAAAQAAGLPAAPAARVPVAPNARLAVGGAVRKIMSFASKRKGSQQQQEDEASGGQVQQQQAVAGGEPSKRPRLLLAEQAQQQAAADSAGTAGSAGSTGAAAMDMYSLGGSGPSEIFTTQPSGKQGQGASSAAQQAAAGSSLSRYSFSMGPAPPTQALQQDAQPAASSSAATGEQAGAALPTSSADSSSSSSSRWSFSFTSLPRRPLLKMGSSPAALLPAPKASAPVALLQPPADATAAPAPAPAVISGKVWSANGIQYASLVAEGASWQQAAAELAVQLGQQEPSTAGWKALPGRVLHAAGALVQGIASRTIQPVADALQGGQHQVQQEQVQQQGSAQQAPPQVLLFVAQAGQLEQLQQLQQAQELQPLLQGLAAAGVALLPVLLHDPAQHNDRKLQQAKHALAAALHTGHHAVLVLPVQQQLLQGEALELTEPQQGQLMDGIARLKQRLLQRLVQQDGPLVSALQLRAKM